MDGIINLELKNLMLKLSKPVKCLFLTLSIYHLFSRQAIKGMSSGQKKDKDGSLLQNLLCLFFGDIVKVNIFFEHLTNKSICHGTGQYRSAISKQEPFVTGKLKRQENTLDSQLKTNIMLLEIS